MSETREVATIDYTVRPRVPFRPPRYIRYPESDGEPMAETDTHINLLIYLREALSDYFRDAPDVYVAGNLFLYYEEGDPTEAVAPDVFVVKGVPKHARRIYKVWEEGKGPDVVFEITSKLTRKQDLGPKKGLYWVLGAEEYFLFDPFGDYLEPRLAGFRRREWWYHPIKDEEPLRSRVLGLEIRVEGEMLRLIDQETGERLLTPQEVYEAHRRAEAEVERLRAELARLKADD